MATKYLSVAEYNEAFQWAQKNKDKPEAKEFLTAVRRGKVKKQVSGEEHKTNMDWAIQNLESPLAKDYLGQVKTGKIKVNRDEQRSGFGGFVKNLGTEVADTFRRPGTVAAKWGTTIGEALSNMIPQSKMEKRFINALGVTGEQAQRERRDLMEPTKLTASGRDLRAFRSPQEAVGETALASLDLAMPAFGGPVGAGAKAVGTRIGLGAARGGIAGFGEAMRREQSAGQVAGQTAFGSTVGALTTGLLEAGRWVTRKALTPLLHKTGSKIEKAGLKVSNKDLKNGFKYENLDKYNVRGKSMTKGYEIIDDKMTENFNTVNNAVKDSNVKIDLKKVINNAEKAQRARFAAGKDSEVAAQIGSQFDRIRQNYNLVAGKHPGAKGPALVDLTVANNLKRSAGQQGAFAFGNPDPDVGALGKAYNALGFELKQQIEGATRKLTSGESAVRVANKEISEMIPIEQVLIKRLNVLDRSSLLGLNDAITLTGTVASGNLKGLGLFIANRLAKSAPTGGRLMNLAGRLNLPKGVPVDGDGAFLSALNALRKPAESAVRQPTISAISKLKREPKKKELGVDDRPVIKPFKAKVVLDDGTVILGTMNKFSEFEPDVFPERGTKEFEALSNNEGRIERR